MTIIDHEPDVLDDTNEPDAPHGRRPWWQSRINLATLAIAIAVLAGALGWVIGNNRAIPDGNATDTGFLQDMRWHHDQAVELAFIYLNAGDADGALRTNAREILLGQAIEVGQMVELLRSFGAAEANETDVAMAWMDEPVPIDRMPGLATEADIDLLAAAGDADADRTFVTLMVAHHQGGIHMAEHAADHAGDARVRTFARQMAESQAEEIVELERLLDISLQQPA